MNGMQAFNTVREQYADFLEIYLQVSAKGDESS